MDYIIFYQNYCSHWTKRNHVQKIFLS